MRGVNVLSVGGANVRSGVCGTIIGPTPVVPFTTPVARVVVAIALCTSVRVIDSSAPVVSVLVHTSGVWHRALVWVGVCGWGVGDGGRFVLWCVLVVAIRVRWCVGVGVGEGG